MKRPREEVATEQVKKPKIEKPITLERCLNDLAWLLESESASVAAVSLVKNKLLIADNNIIQSTGNRGNNKKIDYKYKLLEYFSDFVQGKEALDQKNIFEIVANEKSRGGLSSRRRTSIEGTSGTLGDKVKRRITRIETFLKNNKEHPLYLVFQKKTEKKDLYLNHVGAANYQDRCWLLSEEEGIGFVKTNEEGTHAELKIIDFLLATRLITLKQTTMSFPIGISKKCCQHCHAIVEIINKHLKKEGVEVLKTTGTHGLDFDEKWIDKKPIFLEKPKEPEEIRGHYDYCASSGLYFAELFESEGYYLAGKKNEAEAILFLEEFEKSKDFKSYSEKTYLYRDRELLKMIRADFIEWREANKGNFGLKNKGVRMSQSSPEVSSEENLQGSLGRVDVLNSIRKVPTSLLIMELIARFSQDSEDFTEEDVQILQEAIEQRNQRTSKKEFSKKTNQPGEVEEQVKTYFPLGPIFSIRDIMVNILFHAYEIKPVGLGELRLINKQCYLFSLYVMKTNFYTLGALADKSVDELERISFTEVFKILSAPYTLFHQNTQEGVSNFPSIAPKKSNSDIFSKDLSLNKNYFDAMSQALTRLNSNALPEHETGDNEIIQYLKLIFKKNEKVIVSDDRWSLDTENEEKALFFMGTSFPCEQFLKFLMDSPQGSCFILPINIKASHYCGLAIRIKEKKIHSDLTSIQIECHYINPTSSKEKVTAEDRQVFQSLKEVLDKFETDIFAQLVNPDFNGKINDPMDGGHTINLSQENWNKIRLIPVAEENIINHSCYQQESTCDCGFIVAQSLVDIARENNLTIPNFRSDPEQCIEQIAGVRAVFGNDQQKIREQYFLRLAKALFENRKYSEPLRKWLAELNLDDLEFNTPKKNFLTCLQETVKQHHSTKFEGLDGDGTTDTAKIFISKNLHMQDITAKELNEYCNWLLEPLFEAQGSVIFKLHQNHNSQKKSPAATQPKTLLAVQHEEYEAAYKEACRKEEEKATHQHEEESDLVGIEEDQFGQGSSHGFSVSMSSNSESD